MTSVSGVKNLGTDLPEDTDQVDQRQEVIILGSFKRGRVDKPFKVTKANYRAKLGFDYQNHHYMTVEDLLNNGAPYVWIQRAE